MFFRNSRIRFADITDGTSQTIAVRNARGRRPRDLGRGCDKGTIRRGPQNNCPTTGQLFYPAATLVQAHCHMINTNGDPDGGLDDSSSLHPSGANFLFADGSVHFLKNILADAGVRPNGSQSTVRPRLSSRRWRHGLEARSSRLIRTERQTATVCRENPSSRRPPHAAFRRGVQAELSLANVG